MRQKKSNFIFYVVAIAIVVLVGFVAFTELPAEIEHIEETVN